MFVSFFILQRDVHGRQKEHILCSIWSCCIKNMTRAICHFELLKSHWKEYHSKKVALYSVVIPWAILCIYPEFLFNPENSFHYNLPKFFVDHIYLPISICHTPKIETIIPACTPLLLWWQIPYLIKNHCCQIPSSLACENIRFSSLFADGGVSRGGTSATQRQKFHTVWNPVRSADWLTE